MTQRRVELGREDIRLAQLGLLERFSEFCERQGLRYFLYGGTLLGAARHDGYIPWDDDIDVLMPRSDFERFCAEFPSAEPASAKLHAASLDSTYPLPFAKFSDPTTLLIESSDLGLSVGVNIDIFPLDGWPQSDILSWLHRHRIMVWRRILDMKSIAISPTRGKAKNTVLFVGKVIFGRVSEPWLARRISWVARKYDVDRSDYVGVSVWGVQERVHRRLYEQEAKLQFEQGIFPVPAGYDGILSAIYGDYMVLPPVNKRGTHHAFEAYRLS